MSVDLLTKHYPELTPYQFASNTPIECIDLDGLEKAKKPQVGTKPQINNTPPVIPNPTDKPKGVVIDPTKYTGQPYDKHAYGTNWFFDWDKWLNNQQKQKDDNIKDFGKKRSVDGDEPDPGDFTDYGVSETVTYDETEGGAGNSSYQSKRSGSSNDSETNGKRFTFVKQNKDGSHEIFDNKTEQYNTVNKKGDTTHVRAKDVNGKKQANYKLVNPRKKK
jgi:hypothetical protein